MSILHPFIRESTGSKQSIKSGNAISLSILKILFITSAHFNYNVHQFKKNYITSKTFLGSRVKRNFGFGISEVVPLLLTQLRPEGRTPSVLMLHQEGRESAIPSGALAPRSSAGT